MEDIEQTLRDWLQEACDGVSEAFLMDAASLTEPQQEPFENLAVVGFTGDNFRGSLGVSADWRLLQNFLKQLHPDKPEIPHGMMLDTLGEIANQVLGRLKNSLSSHGVDVTMTPPTVIRGLRIVIDGTRQGFFLRQDLDSPFGPLSAWLDAKGTEDLVLKPTEQSTEEGEMLLFF